MITGVAGVAGGGSGMEKDYDNKASSTPPLSSSSSPYFHLLCPPCPRPSRRFRCRSLVRRCPREGVRCTTSQPRWHTRSGRAACPLSSRNTSGGSLGAAFARLFCGALGVQCGKVPFTVPPRSPHRAANGRASYFTRS